MNDLNAAEQWGEVVRHLVRAHGAEPGRLIARAASKRPGGRRRPARP
jgi:hypothetical protein